MTHSTKKFKPNVNHEKDQEVSRRMQKNINRMIKFSGWYIMAPGFGVDRMLREIYVQNSVNQAFVTALTKVMRGSGQWTELQLREEAVKALEGLLASLERDCRVIITEAQCGAIIDPDVEAKFEEQKVAIQQAADAAAGGADA